jgi:hypothetical protein
VLPDPRSNLRKETSCEGGMGKPHNQNLDRADLNTSIVKLLLVSMIICNPWIPDLIPTVIITEQ